MTFKMGVTLEISLQLANHLVLVLDEYKANNVS